MSGVDNEKAQEGSLRAEIAAAGIERRAIQRYRGGDLVSRGDHLAIESPLAIQLMLPGPEGLVRRDISVTMRTPGQDLELAVGFLFSEGIITAPDAIVDLLRCEGPQGQLRGNVVQVCLAPGVEPDLASLERHVYTSSSCGVCGKTSIEAVEAAILAPPAEGPKIPASLLLELPRRLRRAQAVFEQTGGLHAAARFDARGQLLAMAEDVGRHNAMDKLLGRALLEHKLPLHDQIVLLSGRASFELVQKALMAQVGILAAVGAPSSLAVELAQRHQMTLVGFLRGESFNLYSGAERLH